MAVEFIGRGEELALLEGLFKKNVANLVIIQGRRRIGKSRLVDEFARKKRYYAFAGLPPSPETTAQMQRDEFARKLGVYFGLPGLKASDWADLFTLLAKQTTQGSIVILFDEISWMGSKDPTFLGKLKNAWDTEFKKNPGVMLVLCSSISSWVDKNILSSTGFMGRVSYVLTLDELPLKDCDQFWRKQGDNISPYEKLKFLSVAGGVPLYLEAMEPCLPAEENIRQLAFLKGGLLLREFNNIFSDLFSKRSATYRKIVEILIGGPLEMKEVCEQLKIRQTGWISTHLNDLVTSGFIQRDYTWALNSGEDSKLSTYRLSDNYLRFYLKYIAKNKAKIERGAFTLKSLTALPGWDTIMGLQFENLVLNNRKEIKNILKIKPEEVISDNPFFQHKNLKQPGCQIDYLVQTRFNTLYVCEIKFSKQPIGVSIIDEVQEKINCLVRPAGFSCRPVLIHVNGVTVDVEDGGYFAEIIDFSRLLEAAS